MRRSLVMMVLVLLTWAVPLRAEQPSLAGYYNTTVPTEWYQELFLLDQDHLCFIMRENWLPGKSDKSDITYLACTWRQEGDQVVLEYDGMRDVLEVGVWEQDDVEPYGPRRGLRRVSENSRSQITRHPFWRSE